jgi:hypothetical protein
MNGAKILAASFGLSLFVWLIPSSIEIAAWTRGGISRIALLAPLYTLWIALASAAMLAAALWAIGGAGGRPARAHIVAPLAALWLVCVPFAPWLPDRFPLLLVFAGPLRWAIAAAAALTVVVRLARAVHVGGGIWTFGRAWLSRAGARTVFVVSLVLFLAAGLRSLEVIGLGGDEPHYLVITHSLLVDRDLQIENNHARGDYRAFFAGDLKPDYLQRGVNGEIYSIHAPGLGVLMLPGYALAGSAGAVATICLLAAAAAALVFEAAFLMAGPLVAWATWAACCLSAPFIPHAWALYPEIPGALIAACVVVWALRAAPAGVSAWLARGALVAVLPWLHTKFAVLLAAFTLWMLVELRWRIKESAAFLAPIAVSGAAWLSFFYVIYGTFDPQAPYGGHVAQFIHMSNIPRSLLGLLADQKFGLFVYAPVYLAAIAGAWMLLAGRGALAPDLLERRRQRTFAWFLIGTAAGYAAGLGREYMWWGGSSAPARFFVPIVPVLAPMVAVSFAGAQRAGRSAVVAVLASIGVLISLAAAAGRDPYLFFSDPHGVSRLFAWLQGSAPLTAAFPTFTDENWTAPLVRLLPWIVALAAAAAVALAGRARSRYASLVSAFAAFLIVAAITAAPVSADAKLEAATRGRATLMNAFDPERLRGFDYASRSKLTPAQWISATGITIELDPSEPADGYGRLTQPLALPPGAYTAAVWFQGARERDGDLLLTAGNGQILRRVAGPLPNPTRLAFELPLAVPGVTVQLTEVRTAQQAVRVEIVPDTLVPASRRLAGEVRGVEPIAGPPNAYMDYLDDHSYPEGGVFWTRGTDRATVAVAPAGAHEIVLTLHVGPNAGTVHLSIGDERRDLQLRAEETRDLSIAPPPGARYVVIAAQAPADFRPSDVDPSSSDTRRLGVQIRVSAR